ncbi:putative late blight resistance protein homolog R1B-23 isoform X2 [Salvia miltiorrhiza]|uniref:putative late blight resistance protein homolog R1B-23 isoform X2 n=1 Tax=Salvia miltiorrhiza TaxID=226208 RepID=UPI0025ACEFA0|nr:putative late blight resistance protein homolog R1B-23 isoform X2 [Salvia miltiorrhiza]
MTAYGAANSLRNTIDYILHSSHFIVVDPSPRILQLAYEELDPLQEILERLDRTRTSKSRKKVNALDGRIKELIWEFEDLLESPLYQQILSQVEDEGIMKEGAWGFQGLLESLPSQSSSLEDEDDVGGERMRFSIDLQFLQHHVPSFIQRLKDMKEEYIYEVDNMPEDDFDDQSISSRSGTKSKMIGLSDQFQQLKASLMKRSNWSTANEYIAIHGSAGIGKTTLAATVFEDPDILCFYGYRVWVSIGRKSQFDEVSRSILAEMSGVRQSKNCLIVLDDVWEKQIMDSLENFLLQMDWRVFVCILVTTRDTNTTSPSFSRLMMVRFLKEEESKELLCEKVFGEKDCPFQLDKAATKIAKKCEGLPLMIVTVANILSKSQSIDPKYWDDVAENRNSVFIDAYNEISKCSNCEPTPFGVQSGKRKREVFSDLSFF